MAEITIQQDWNKLDTFLENLGVSDKVPAKTQKFTPPTPTASTVQSSLTTTSNQVQESTRIMDNEVEDPNDYYEVDVPERILERSNVELKENRVYLGTALCGIYIDCEEIKIGDMYIVLVLKEEYGSHFDLHPGSRFYFCYLDLTNTKIEIKIYFSGIIFHYETKSFLVFHLVE